MQKYIIWYLTNYEDQLRSLTDDPRQLDYKTGLNIRLHPEYSFDKGELKQVLYYKTYGDTDSLVLKVDIEWIRDGSTLNQRIEKRSYVVESDEGVEFGSHIKISHKFYNQTTAAKADVKRRSNIIDNLTAKAEGFGVLPYVQTLFRSLDDELNAYKATGDDTILGKINTYVGQWLETPVPDTPLTLRQLIIHEMTI